MFAAKKEISVKCLESGVFSEARESFYADCEVNLIINEGGENGAENGGENGEKNSEKNGLKTTFFCLEGDLEALVWGYLWGVEEGAIQKISQRESFIFVTLEANPAEIRALLEPKNLTHDCESIAQDSPLKIAEQKIILPFNDSRAEALGANLASECEAFFGESNRAAETRESLGGESFGGGESSESGESRGALGGELCESFEALSRVKIKDSRAGVFEALDTVPINALFKALGMFRMANLRESRGVNLKSFGEKSCEKSGGESCRESNAESSDKAAAKAVNPPKNSLLDSIIFVNFAPNSAILSRVILAKATFLVCDKKPAFSVVKAAARFGLTLVFWDCGALKILTHSLRVKC